MLTWQPGSGPKNVIQMSGVHGIWGRQPTLKLGAEGDSTNMVWRDVVFELGFVYARVSLKLYRLPNRLRGFSSICCSRCTLSNRKFCICISGHFAFAPRPGLVHAFRLKALGADRGADHQGHGRLLGTTIAIVGHCKTSVYKFLLGEAGFAKRGPKNKLTAKYANNLART